MTVEIITWESLLNLYIAFVTSDDIEVDEMYPTIRDYASAIQRPFCDVLNDLYNEYLGHK